MAKHTIPDDLILLIRNVSDAGVSEKNAILNALEEFVQDRKIHSYYNHKLAKERASILTMNVEIQRLSNSLENVRRELTRLAKEIR